MLSYVVDGFLCCAKTFWLDVAPFVCLFFCCFPCLRRYIRKHVAMRDSLDFSAYDMILYVENPKDPIKKITRMGNLIQVK